MNTIDELFDYCAQGNAFPHEDVWKLFGITEKEWQYKFNGIGCSGYKIITIFDDDEESVMPESRFQFDPDEFGTYPTPLIYALYCDGEDGAAIIRRNFDSHEGSLQMTIGLGNYLEFDQMFAIMQAQIICIIGEAENGAVYEELNQNWRKKRYELTAFSNESWAEKIMNLDGKIQ